MKHVNVEKLVAEAVPLRPSLTTRKEKLTYLANLVRRSVGHPRYPGQLTLWHRVEEMSSTQLGTIEVHNYPFSVFGLADGDKELKKAGLGKTMLEHMTFFEVSQYEMHQFSCDCGGAMSVNIAAAVLDKLANSAPQAAEPTAFQKFRSYFNW